MIIKFDKAPPRWSVISDLGMNHANKLSLITSSP
jgi:hypothetical protein